MDFFHLRSIWKLYSNIYCPRPSGKIQKISYFWGLKMSKPNNFVGSYWIITHMSILMIWYSFPQITHLHTEIRALWKIGHFRPPCIVEIRKMHLFLANFWFFGHFSDHKWNFPWGSVSASLIETFKSIIKNPLQAENADDNSVEKWKPENEKFLKLQENYLLFKFIGENSNEALLNKCYFNLTGTRIGIRMSVSYPVPHDSSGRRKISYWWYPSSNFCQGK